MCIGLPMQVVTPGLGSALCRTRDGTERTIDTALVGTPEPGTWILTYLDGAREVIDAETADRIADALQAVGAAMDGTADPALIDSLFPDLANRTPELPEHLRPQAKDTAST